MTDNNGDYAMVGYYELCFSDFVVFFFIGLFCYISGFFTGYYWDNHYNKDKRKK
jgi:hypothetical protein